VFVLPFRRDPIRFLPKSWVIKVFASRANLANIIISEKTTVKSVTSGIISLKRERGKGI
jgi:hypothetical protein